MARPDKAAAVAELADKFRSSSAAVLTEYRGLTVAQLTQLRRAIGGHATYAVVKNTLTEIAAREAGVDGLDEPRSPARPPSPSSPATRSRRPRACGLRQGQPRAGHQGRRARRQPADRGRDRQARGPRVPRGAAGQAGRRDEGVADQGRLPVRRPAVAGGAHDRRPARSSRRAPLPRPAGTEAPRRRPAAAEPADRRRVATEPVARSSPPRADPPAQPPRAAQRPACTTPKGTPPWRSSAPTSCSTRSRR